jgi:hypothetical protein
MSLLGGLRAMHPVYRSVIERLAAGASLQNDEDPATPGLLG